MTYYEKLRRDIKTLCGTANEEELVKMWNKYVEENMETETENIKLYLNDAENIANIISNMSKEGIANSIAQSCYVFYNPMEKYVYEMGDRLYSTNSMFPIINTYALERFCAYLQAHLTKKVTKFGRTWEIVRKLDLNMVDDGGTPIWWKVLEVEDGVLWMNNLDGEMAFVETNGRILTTMF